MSPPVKGETLQKQVLVMFMQLWEPQWALDQLLSSHRTPIKFSREDLGLWFPRAEHDLMLLLGKLDKKGLLWSNQIIIMIRANVASLRENEEGHGEFESSLGYIPTLCLHTKGNEDVVGVGWK